MLKFVIEWEDEPRVRDPLLRATWARLEIHGRDGEREVCLTTCVGERSKSLRRGVYGSVFPLAQWAVAHWWSLFSESPRSEQFGGGRAHGADPLVRPWLQRHNLLAARSGFALPDLSIYQDGGYLAVRCVPDPPDLESAYPVRFVAAADLRLSPPEVDSGLRALVESVSDRVRETAPADSREAAEFLADWEAIQESAREEPKLCATAAAMGLDPYDPEELTDELASLLEGPFESLPCRLRWDLAESASGPTLPADFRWTRAAVDALGDTGNGADAREHELPGAELRAHLAGYDRARWFRDSFGLPPIVEDLEEFARDRCGWQTEPVLVAPEGGVVQRINGAVSLGSGGPRLALPSLPGLPATRRFLLGRALFFAPNASTASTPRLLTRASSWSQRASRSFAAELLAPASELARQVTGPVSYEQVTELAHLFRVSEMVIKHQLENHQIAELVDL